MQLEHVAGIKFRIVHYILKIVENSIQHMFGKDLYIVAFQDCTDIETDRFKNLEAEILKWWWCHVTGSPKIFPLDHKPICLTVHNPEYKSTALKISL